MISHAPRYRPNDFVITPYHDACGGPHANVSTPASGAWVSANRATLYPVSLPEPFTVAKAYWCNGATVGTDSIDMGIYMVDLSAGRADLMRSLGGVLSAGSANVVQESATWRTAKANIIASSSSTDLATYTTASVTMKAGYLYLMAVENSHGTSASAVSAITNGGTWASRSSTQYNTNLNRISIWSCVPTVDYTGTIDIAFGGTTQTGACWALDMIAGVDTTTTDGIVQQAVGTGSSVTPLATLGAFGNANNATYGAHGHAAATASAPGTGFTELSDVTAATPAQALETEWQVGNDTTVDATITSAAWGMCAVEIKADASSPIIPVSTILSAVRPYMAFVVSGVTATVFRASTAGANIMGLAGRLTANTAYPLPSTLTPAINASSAEILGGFSSRSLIG